MATDMQTAELRCFPLPSQLGRVLSQRFRIDALLGTGSMGAVFRAWDIESDQPCAVKLLLPERDPRQMVNVRFRDEARMSSQLCHPNIVEVWDHYQEPDGTLYLVMELLQGQDLYTLLQTQVSLPLAQTLPIVKQIGSALHTVHLAGIVHRDIKPKNIFLIDGSDPDSLPTVKIIDFGFAKLLNQGRASRRGSDGMLIGTPAYLPPEAWNGISADVDARADQWALAALTYLMLSGQLPYVFPEDGRTMVRPGTLDPPTPLCELVRDIPPHIDCAVARALSKNKEHRFPCVLDFLRAIHNLPPAAQAFHSRSSTIPVVEFTPLLMPATVHPGALASSTNPLLSTLVAEALANRTPTPPFRLDEPSQPLSLASNVTPIGAREAEPGAGIPISSSGTAVPVRCAEAVKLGHGLGASHRQKYSRYVVPALSVAAALVICSGLRFGRGSICASVPNPPGAFAAAASWPTPGFREQIPLCPAPVQVTPLAPSCINDGVATASHRQLRKRGSRSAKH